MTFFSIHLFTCAYIAGAISPPAFHPKANDDSNKDISFNLEPEIHHSGKSMPQNELTLGLTALRAYF
jgi:hypothetical protein